MIYGKILGVQDLGKSNYAKHSYVAFCDSGILYFSDFVTDREHVYPCGKFVAVRWSTRFAKYIVFPLAEDLLDGVRDLWAHALDSAFSS